MSTNVTIQISETLFRRLQEIADQAQRSVEDILASSLTILLSSPSDLPEVLTKELADMIWLSDQDLWAATSPTFTPEKQERLAELNDLNDDRELSEVEMSKRLSLLAQYDRAILRRAQAFAILARRGHPIPKSTELSHLE